MIMMVASHHACRCEARTVSHAFRLFAEVIHIRLFHICKLPSDHGKCNLVFVNSPFDTDDLTAESTCMLYCV